MSLHLYAENLRLGPTKSHTHNTSTLLRTAIDRLDHVNHVLFFAESPRDLIVVTWVVATQNLESQVRAGITLAAFTCPHVHHDVLVAIENINRHRAP